MAILFLLAFALFKKLITCNFAGYFFLPVFSQKNNCVGLPTQLVVLRWCVALRPAVYF